MKRRDLIKALVGSGFLTGIETKASPENFESSLIFEEFQSSRAAYGVVFYNYLFAGEKMEDFKKFQSLKELTDLETEVGFVNFEKPVFYIYA